jgi:hypothetical protein
MWTGSARSPFGIHTPDSHNGYFSERSDPLCLVDFIMRLSRAPAEAPTAIVFGFTSATEHHGSAGVLLFKGARRCCGLYPKQWTVGCIYGLMGTASGPGDALPVPRASGLLSPSCWRLLFNSTYQHVSAL